jgi:hypothetical protein
MVAMVRCRAAKAWSGLDGVLQLRGWCDFDVVVIVAPVSGLRPMTLVMYAGNVTKAKAP